MTQPEDFWIWAVWGLRTLLLFAFPFLVIAAHRHIARPSFGEGPVVALGTAARAFLGAGLFYVSYLDLPLLRGLHFGDGFWQLALDARGYYDAAQTCIEQGAGALPEGVPSVTFVRLLAAWMSVVGSSPAAGLMLNLFCYLAICWILVRQLSPGTMATRAALLAFAFSPTLVAFGTQPMKDVLFALLIVLGCLGARGALSAVGTARLRKLPRRSWLSISALPLAIYLMSGIRPYYPAFVVVAVSAALAWMTMAGGWRAAGARLARSVTLVAVLLLAWAAGLGPYADVYYAPPLLRQLAGGAPATGTEAGRSYRLAEVFDRSRDAFALSGGGTNTAAPQGERPSPLNRFQATLKGALLVVVPVTLLESAGMHAFSGGRGLTLLADADTIFIDVLTIAIVVGFVRESRKRGCSVPFVLFTAVLAVTVGLSLAYVVTNFGTLLRLRIMLVVPLWMLPLALPPARSDGAVAAESNTVAAQA